VPDSCYYCGSEICKVGYMTRMRETRKEHGMFGGKREPRRPREGEMVTFVLV
jgi:hypothetical protein